MVVQCAWCQKVRLSIGWVKGFFHLEQASHGPCPDCHQAMRAQIKR